ncbi:MAG: MarR family transcriptional regulator [Spirochaetales bacterium]|nr:MarR family transcriptional regulator [Spirochaetales bacterium]
MKDEQTNNSIQNYIRAQKFYFLAEQCLNLIQKSMQPVLKEYNLNHSQHLVLLIMWYSNLSGNEIISTEIACLLGLEKHSISTIIDTLYKRGLIDRHRNKKDRRSVNIKLTEKGVALVEAHHPRTMDNISFDSDLTSEDFKFLFTFLESLRVITARKNNQSPSIYSSAFKKLLLDGQEKYVEKYSKEGFNA